MLNPNQKAMIEKATNALEAVRGELSVLTEALEELDSLTQEAEADTALADMDGEMDASGIDTELYYLEEKLEKFSKALGRYTRECAEAEQTRELEQQGIGMLPPYNVLVGTK